MQPRRSPVETEDFDPLFGDEQGWFGDRKDDRRDGSLEASVWRRKHDFLRLRDFALHLAQPRPGIKLLELGCANGAQMTLSGLLGAEVYGQDLSSARVGRANSKLEQLHIEGEAKLGDVTRLLFDDNMFDVVLSSDFHEHVSVDIKIASFREAHRVLRPGGVMVIKTPNLSYLRASLAFKRLRAVARGSDPRGYVIAHTDRNDPDSHVGLTTRRELSRCLERAGFQTFTFHYPPLRRPGYNPLLELLSTELPVVRDVFCPDLFCRAYKPIGLSYFPDRRNGAPLALDTDALRARNVGLLHAERQLADPNLGSGVGAPQSD